MLLQRVTKDNTLTFQKDANKNFEVSQWNTSNKYYSAQISFTVIADRNEIPGLTPYEAIVLVLDLTSPESVIKNELREWNNVLLQSNERAMSCLLVGNYPNLSFWDENDNKKIESLLQMHEYLHEWCVDHNYEFIPSPYISNENETNAWKILLSTYSEEELGSQRVFDALQCVQWPEIAMAQRKKGETQRPMEKKQDIDDEKYATSTVKDKLESKMEESGKPIVTEDNEDEHMSAEEDEEDWRDTKNDDLVNEFAKCWSDDKSNKESDNDGKKSQEKESKFENSFEWDMQAFDSLVEEMKTVRQASRSGELSQEQRKKAAADAAMKLYHYMGLDELEGSQSEEEPVDID